MEGIDEQKQDKNIVWIIRLIHDNLKEKPEITEFENSVCRSFYGEFENLRLINDILYRAVETDEGIIRYQYVLPEHQIELVIEHIHCLTFGGHLGLKKTTEKVIYGFYRPKLKVAIEKFVRKCDICQKIKFTQPIRRGELHIIRSSRPNELVTSDIAGPFPKTKNGNRFILVVICSFTKFAEVYAITDTKASTLATKIVDEWICRFGVPEQILTD